MRRLLAILVVISGLLSALCGQQANAGRQNATAEAVADKAGISLTADLAMRRESLAKKLEAGGVMILFSAPKRNKSGDVDYPYRQDSNLFYLTGIAQAGTILLMFSHHQKTTPVLLFIEQLSAEEEIWRGRGLRPEEARAMSGITHVYAAAEFDKLLTLLLRADAATLERLQLQNHPFVAQRRQKKTVVYFDLERKGDEDSELSREKKFARRLQGRFNDLRWHNVVPLLHPLRLIKSPYEIDAIQHAIHITGQSLAMVADELQSGLHEHEIRAVVEFVFQQHGADWAFPSIVAGGVNATTMHYPYGRRRLADGDLLLLDIGASHNYYGADITRTLPVSGTFTPEQRAIYEIIQTALEQATTEVKPGNTLAHVHHRAEIVIAEGLLRLGLIPDVKSGAHTLYYMHGTSHWLGLDTHDVGPYLAPFKPGMVLTVEPGIYVAPDLLARAAQEFGEQMANKIAPHVARYQDIGIRIEDDVLVTADGCTVLSSAIPRRIDDVEAWLQKK